MSSPGLKKVLGLFDKSQVSMLSTLIISAGYTLSKGVMFTADTMMVKMSRFLIVFIVVVVWAVKVEPGLQARFNFGYRNTGILYGVLSIYPVSTTGLTLLPKYAMPPQFI